MTDSYREDGRLSGIRTLDIWEPWQSGKVKSGQISWPPLVGGRSTNMLAPLQGQACIPGWLRALDVMIIFNWLMCLGSNPIGDIG